MKFYLIRCSLRIMSVAPVINDVVALNLHHGTSDVGLGCHMTPIIQVSYRFVLQAEEIYI